MKLVNFLTVITLLAKLLQHAVMILLKVMWLIVINVMIVHQEIWQMIIKNIAFQYHLQDANVVREFPMMDLLVKLVQLDKLLIIIILNVLIFQLVTVEIKLLVIVLIVSIADHVEMDLNQMMIIHSV